MKRMDIFCASQASTAIRHNPDQNTPDSTTTLLGGAALDRHNPIIGDSRKPPRHIPHPPTIPQKLHLTKKKKHILDNHENDQNHLKKSDFIKLDDDTKSVKKRWSCTSPGDFLSPPGSTRYLLREKAVENENENEMFEDVKTEDLCSSHSVIHQEVFLKVSLHCRGCEKKLRKHLSRMEGVTSFNIDFAAKKVTVAGNVTPLGVLSSISKVKNAQLWSPTIASEFSNNSKKDDA